MQKLIWVVGLVVCQVVHPVASMGEVTAVRDFDTLSADVNEPVTVTFELTSTEASAIRGFYYADHIPADLSVTPVSVEVDGNPLDASDYTYETGSVGGVYSGCRANRWVLETPPSYGEDNPVSASVTITYRVESTEAGTYTFPNYNWVGNAVGGVGVVFGYDEGEPPILEVAGGGEGEGEGTPPVPYGTPGLTLVGLVTLASAIAFVTVRKSRVKVGGDQDVSQAL